MIKIVIDTYGADGGAEPIILGVAKALKNKIDFFPILVGDANQITSIMNEKAISSDAYEVINADKFITNNDLPTAIFGGNDDTSMAIAYDRLKNDDECAALLSAGNTGAMLVGSICRLGLVGGLKFPSLCSALPCSKEKLLCLVDCGANVDCTSNDLVRFAIMGDVFSKCYLNIEKPRVGLMSVGREAQKGNALTKEAFDKISQLDINFVGNLEGSDMVSGYADVVVCDGFSGNILLKATEAAGKAAMEIVKTVCDDAALAEKIADALFLKFDFNSRGAATFLGPKKTVVKMHGIANADTTVASIEQILRLEKSQFSKRIAEAMKN